jgi:hypothetical protein
MVARILCLDMHFILYYLLLDFSTFGARFVLWKLILVGWFTWNKDNDMITLWVISKANIKYLFPHFLLWGNLGLECAFLAYVGLSDGLLSLLNSSCMSCLLIFKFHISVLLQL